VKGASLPLPAGHSFESGLGRKASVFVKIHKFGFPAGILLVLFVSSMWAAAPQGPEQEGEGVYQFVVPAGRAIPIVLTSYLNTRSTQVGNTVYADTTYPIWIQQRLVIPKGSTVRGTITEVVRPGRIRGKGRLSIRFDDILLPNGVTREFIVSLRGIHGAGDENLDHNAETVASGSSTGTDAGTVASTTGQGAIVGAISGGGKGAGIGAGAGAAAGVAVVLLTRGRDLILQPGTEFDLELSRPLTFAFNELEFTNSQLNSAQRTIYRAPANQRSRPPMRRFWPFPRIGTPAFMLP